MNAHAAILQALYARAHSGEGAGIAVSLFDGLADWMAVPLLHHDYGGKAPGRVGLAHPSIAPYGEFRLPGGRSVVISVQNQREWRSLCQLIDRDAMAADPRFADNLSRCPHRSDLVLPVEEVFVMFYSESLAVLLTAAGKA